LDLVSAQIPPGWLLASWLTVGALLAATLQRAPWGSIAVPAGLNVFSAACVAVMVLWRIKAGVQPGLSLHVLGATVLTLMFRPFLALLATAIVAAVMALWTQQYAAFAGNWLIMGVLPVAVSWAIHLAVVRLLPRHLFVYLFVNAFAAAAVSMLAVGAGSAFAALCMGSYSGEYLRNEYLPFFLLMAWSEAFLTGMLVTLIVVWKPRWISTFSDEVYLAAK
jgi:uncharacterized membrane protein